MKINTSIIAITILLFTNMSYSSAQKGKNKADKETNEWRYEIEAQNTGQQGTYLIKVWTYSKNVETAINQAKKNAVHGVIFKGFSGKDRIPGQKPLSTNPNLEFEKIDFFKEYFRDGGKYQRYVNLVNNGAINPGDRIKLSKNEYKIGVIVSVNISGLRKDLEEAGIIKKLGNGF